MALAVQPLPALFPLILANFDQRWQELQCEHSHIISQTGTVVFSASTYVSPHGWQQIRLTLDRAYRLICAGLPETLVGRTSHTYHMDARTMILRPAPIVLTGSNLEPLVPEEFPPAEQERISLYPALFQEDEFLPEE